MMKFDRHHKINPNIHGIHGQIKNVHGSNVYYVNLENSLSKLSLGKPTNYKTLMIVNYHIKRHPECLHNIHANSMTDLTHKLLPLFKTDIHNEFSNVLEPKQLEQIQIYTANYSTKGMPSIVSKFGTCDLNLQVLYDIMTPDPATAALLNLTYQTLFCNTPILFDYVLYDFIDINQFKIEQV